MPTLPFTASEIQRAIEFVGISENLNTTAKQTLVLAINEVLQSLNNNASSTGTELTNLSGKIGTLASLNTSNKSNLVSAINELFQSASSGKSAIAAAITGMGINAASSETWSSLAQKITQINTGITPLVVNGGNVVPTGNYATPTYYDLGVGVVVSYAEDGRVIVTMKGGTSTGYENLHFTLSSAPSGVAIIGNSTAYDTADPAGNIFSCILTGIQNKVNMSILMDYGNATYDYVRCEITLTEV